MRNRKILSACTVLLLGACAIPGFGPFAAEVVDRFVNTKFSNIVEPKRTSTGSLYSHVARGEPWIYHTEQEGSGKRYFIRFDYEHCKYSLYVDENDIIRSWRDEGGTSLMNRCLVR